MVDPPGAATSRVVPTPNGRGEVQLTSLIDWTPRGERDVRGQLFPDLLGCRGEPLLIAEDMRSRGQEFVIGGFERIPARHN